jgi:hypothetical protein
MPQKVNQAGSRFRGNVACWPRPFPFCIAALTILFDFARARPKSALPPLP